MDLVLSKRIAESWKDPKVRQARTKRHAVVTRKGVFRCCREAFEAHSLNPRHLISVRKILKVKKHILFTPHAGEQPIEFWCIPFAKYHVLKMKSIDSVVANLKGDPFEFNLEDSFSIAKKLPLPKYRKLR